MARIIITGRSVLIVSALKAADIKLVEKVEPKKLQLIDEETKAAVFAIGTVDIDQGRINTYGITFDDKTADGLACLTILYHGAQAKVKKAFVDEHTKAILALQALEAQVVSAIDEINAKFASVSEQIEDTNGEEVDV